MFEAATQNQSFEGILGKASIAIDKDQRQTVLVVNFMKHQQINFGNRTVKIGAAYVTQDKEEQLKNQIGKAFTGTYKAEQDAIGRIVPTVITIEPMAMAPKAPAQSLALPSPA